MPNSYTPSLHFHSSAHDTLCCSLHFGAINRGLSLTLVASVVTLVAVLM